MGEERQEMAPLAHELRETLASQIKTNNKMDMHPTRLATSVEEVNIPLCSFLCRLETCMIKGATSSL
jgi:hypothetical protein